MRLKKNKSGKVFNPCMRKYKLSKSDFEKLSALYDELCAEADLILKKYNPCAIKNSTCLIGTPCCEDCEYLSNKSGCTVNSLACKLFLCQAAINKFPECVVAFSAIKRIAGENRLLGFRSSKEDVLSYYETA
jgi:hypothetical protein